MFTAIDDLTRPLYAHLTENDQCYFLREYTSGQGYAHSGTNNLINNLKKSPDRRGRAEWQYKERAIEQVAGEMSASLDISRMQQVTLVPIPPSKCKSDPLYDDRMLQVLRRLDPAHRLDIRELLSFRESMPAAHTTINRPTVQQLIDNLEIDQELRYPAPRSIALFDDVITTGVHFIATKTVLLRQFPGIPIRGFFVARRVLVETM